MKTYRQLYPQVIDFANLHQAFRQARKGKRDRPEILAQMEFLRHGIYPREKVWRR